MRRTIARVAFLALLALPAFGSSEFSRADAVITPPTIQFLTDAQSVGEFWGRFIRIYVRRSGDLSRASFIDFATSDGTATASADYVPSSGTLVFAPGHDEEAILLTILDDAADEPKETINLTLSNPRGATLVGPRTAVVTIVDDDGIADVAINMVGSGSPVVPREIIFQIFVYNLGPDMANNVTVTDTFPPGSTLVSAIGACDCTGWPTITCTFPPITPGSTGAWVTLVVDVTDNQTISNTATAASPIDFDPVPANNTATIKVAPGTADIPALSELALVALLLALAGVAAIKLR